MDNQLVEILQPFLSVLAEGVFARGARAQRLATDQRLPANLSRALHFALILQAQQVTELKN